MRKRIGISLFILALLLTLFVYPAAAEDTYAVTLPAGATGETSVAVGEDYVFTLADNALIVAYAEFSDGSICAAEATAILNDNNAVSGYSRRIPADCITGDFEIKTFTVETDGTGSFFDGGDGSLEDPWQIATELQLLKFMASCTVNVESHTLPSVYVGSDKHYILTSDTSDITFHTPLSMQLAPIATDPANFNTFDFAISSFAYGDFSASFDGNGHTISGLRYGGFFSTKYAIALIPLNAGAVKNLTLAVAPAVIQSAYKRPEQTAERYPYFFSPLVGVNSGTIQDCMVTTNKVESQMNGNNVVGTTGDSREICIGLIAAFNSVGTIKGCQADGTVVISESNTKKSLFAGIICGKNFGGTISDCISNGTLNTTATQNTNYIGGIAGQNVKSSAQDNFGNSTTSNVEAMITTCENHANITGSAPTTGTVYVGGIVGVTQNSSISYCFNDKTVTTQTSGGKTENVGGIVGRGNAGGSVTGCYNLGSVSSHGTTTDYAGGIIGHNNSNKIKVEACFSYVENLLAAGLETTNISYVYTRAAATDVQDEATEESTVSAADFASATFDLAGRLNSALPADSEMIFTLAEGAAYPTLIDRPAVTTIDLLTETGVVDTASAAAAGATVTATATGSTATITVTCDKACTVVAYDGTSYTRLAYDGANGHVFTTDAYAPTMTFTVALKGDVSGDGTMDVSDVLDILDAYVTPGTFDALHLLLADVDGNGDMDVSDVLAILDAFVGAGFAW